MDYRHADNPEPFTEMLLERDTRQLTSEELMAIRGGLAEMRQLVSRLAGDLPRLARGEAAADLNRMTGIIMRMRGKLLEFPDKPDPDSQLSRFIDILTA